MPAARRSLCDMPYGLLEQEITASGVRPAHARTLWAEMHRHVHTELTGRSDFLPPLRKWVDAALGENGAFQIDLPSIAALTKSSDGLTHKLLLTLEDREAIETVVMGYTGRFTACLSTQAGCAMGCVFCATGQMGFKRHLRAGEIVAQVHAAQRLLKDSGQGGLRNLVLMGMGEPLHNYDAVMTALEIITDSRGLNIGPSRISISTVGMVPGILRLAEEERPYNLAVSLHGASHEERAALVPAGRRWPMDELIAACRSYGQKTGRRIFFEWTLIAGKNDSLEQAERLAALLEGIDSHVNLIPLNPTQGFSGIASAEQAADKFQAVLQAAGIPSTIRQRRGIDVAAGCGQLRVERERV